MTRKEAKAWFKVLLKAEYTFNTADREAFALAVKALDQEPKTDTLDKVKAEIDQKQYDFMSDGDYDDGIRFGLMLAYQIIDKYKAESEG